MLLSDSSRMNNLSSASFSTPYFAISSGVISLNILSSRQNNTSSFNTFEDILAHAEAGADYIGCGPFRFTTTKKNLSPILGLEGYARIVEQMRQNHISLPIVAIGGIAFEDIPAILQTGVTGIALSGSVLRADDPIAEMRKIVEL